MAPGSAEKNSHKQLMPKLASNVATATCRAEILTLDVDLTWPAAHGAKKSDVRLQVKLQFAFVT